MGYRRKLTGPVEREAPRLRTYSSTTGGSSPAPNDALYLTLAADGDLTSERVFTPSARLIGTDGGAGGTYTADVNQGAAFSWTALHSFAAGITLNGASGANVVTVPDDTAQALNLVDAGGLEYLRIVSTNAQPVIDFNNAPADIDFNVGAIGRANALFIRGSDGLTGLGTNAPDGTLHVHTATAGAVTAVASADDLVVENSGDGGISILTPASNKGALVFGNPTSNQSGYIRYDHALSAMEFASFGSVDFTLYNTSLVASAGSTIDLNGNVDAIILDADGDTTISAPIDDQIDVEIAGADDFSFTANAFNVLSGSGIVMADGATIGQAAGPLLTFDDTNNYLEITGCDVAIGLAVPAGKLHVADTSEINIYLNRATVNPGNLGSFRFSGGNSGSASANVTYSRVTGQETDNTAGSESGIIKFFTVSSGAEGERVRIDSGGRTGFGTTVPLAQVHVDQPSATGVIPVLYLDQGDEDYPVVKIVGTSNAGSASYSLVDASDFGTPGAILGWVQMIVTDTRVGGIGTDVRGWVPLYATPT
jgi:hypothetical protein